MNTGSAPLRLAIAGAGLIGERHARLVSALDGFELAAIIDPAAQTEALATDLSTRHFTDLEKFLESDHCCDGIILATPNETHRSFTLACLKNGLPCLVEKPLAASSADALAIVNASQKTNIPVLVGHHRRHHAVSQTLKERLDSGQFGQIVGAELSWMLRKPDDYFENADWRVRRGGGPVWINLIHDVDLLRYFLGEVTEVFAMFSNTVRSNPVEDTGAITMRFDRGALATAILSDCAPSPWHFEGGSGENPNIAQTGQDGMRIYGTRGSISFPSLTQWRHPDIDGHWGVPIHSHPSELPSVMGSETALTNQLKNFAQVIRGKAQPLVSALDGMQSVRIVEAIHQSAEERRLVEIDIHCESETLSDYTDTETDRNKKAMVKR